MEIPKWTTSMAARCCRNHSVRLAVALLCSSSASIAQVSISGKTTISGVVSLGIASSGSPASPFASNTQMLLTYTAPDSTPCTLEVSESGGYAPLVHDLDTGLFTASPAVNADNRAGNISSGTARQFVIGKRAAEKGSDGHWYSRALQTNTLHYYRLTCSDGAHTGTFTTDNIKIGNTYWEPLPPDPNAAAKPYSSTLGFYAHPEFVKWDITDSTARQETLIDPKTGLLLKRLSMPRDQPLGYGADGPQVFTTATGSAWVSPGNVINDDGASSTYSGTTSDFLFVSDNAFDNSPLNSQGRPTDFLSLQIKAWCSGGGCSSANATIQACLTLDGTTCWPTNATAKFQELILGTSTSPTLTTIGTGCSVPILDCWTPAGYTPLNRVDLKSGGALGWLIRKKSSSTDTINIQYVRYTQGSSLVFDWPATGSFQQCSNTLTQNSVTLGLGYHCVFRTNGTDMLYWIDHTTGDANYLGLFSIPAVAGPNGGFGGGRCNGYDTMAGTTTTAPETVYCSPSNGDDSTPPKAVIVKCTLTSTNQPNDLNNNPGNFACTNLTPAAGGTDLGSLIASFTASDTPAYDPAIFGATITGAQNGKLMINAIRGSQDTIGWNIVVDPAIVSSAPGCVGGGNPGCVVAAMSTWAHAPARWCVNHTSFVSGPTDIVWTAGKYLDERGLAGDGPYVSNITAGSLASATGAIAPGTGLCPAGTLRCDTVTVDGEPCDQTPHGGEETASACPKNAAYAFLQNAAVGDIFTVESEWIRLAAKSGNSWTFQRGYGHRGTSTHSSTVVSAFCSSQDFSQEYTNWSWTWDSAADPHGTNPGGTTIKVAWDFDHPTPYPSQTVGGDPYWDPACSGSTCYAARIGGAMSDPANVVMAVGPKFATAQGVSAFTVLAEDHPGWLQSNAAAAEKLWLLDGRPLRPNVQVSDAAMLVSGQLYKLTSTTTDGDNLSRIGYNIYTVRTSSTVLTAGGNCTSSNHCPIWSDVTLIDGISASCAITVNSGSGTVYISRIAAGGLGVTYTAGLSISASGCPTASGTGFPGGSTQLWTWTATSGTWDVSGGADARVGSSGEIAGINRKLQPTWGYCGSQPLNDISSATTGNVIGDTGTDMGKYCVARLADECRTGSLPGDIYANCANQATRYSSSTYGCITQDSNTYSDFCFGNSSAYLNGIAQVGFASTDLVGNLGRTLTNGLGHYKIIDGFWSAEAFADATWMVFRSMYLDNAITSVMLAKIPPFPASDGTDRTTFVPVPVTVAPVATATNAIIRFGYAENGATTSYYCMTRQEPCVANAATVQAIPFKYQLSDGGGAETGITGLACASGCTITLPGIPGRMIYSQVVWRDGANATVQTGAQEVRKVP